MEKNIFVIDADKNQSSKLCGLLEEENYCVTPIYALKSFEPYIQEKPCQAVIIDIDTVQINNRFIKDQVKKNPDIQFFCVSSNRLHPELRDAISNHICACVKKPVDPEELFFWLSSVYER